MADCFRPNYHFLALIIKGSLVRGDACRTIGKTRGGCPRPKARQRAENSRPDVPHGASHIMCLSPYQIAPMSTIGEVRDISLRYLAQCPAWPRACVACADNATCPRASGTRLEVGRPCGCPATPWLCQYSPGIRPIWLMKMDVDHGLQGCW
ncbi:hypothetical protein BDU57DRAFT_515894 [Ampelomyces quisqualis]|uniref:Uncharacterized protein n=1 Tax=Ampelomyces quisqualis TaxID=50730 RepID=A0A6A5QPV6_AMPQU|nr:hypothetical protein BDU57DRAFT_515894 [Ampelomyces quisqualis]